MLTQWEPYVVGLAYLTGKSPVNYTMLTPSRIPVCVHDV